MYFCSIAEGINVETAAKEATYVYHVIQEGQTYQSTKCTSKLIRNLFGCADFKCSETKSEAIATGNVKYSILGF